MSTELDPDALATMLTTLELGVDRATAARAASISGAELEAALEADAALRRRVDAAEAKAEVRRVAAATKAAQEGDKKAAAWLRERSTSKPTSTKNLTLRQRRFAELYEGPGSGARTAKAAGYTGGDAARRVRASTNLRLAEVRAIIRRRGIELPGEGEDPETDAEAEPEIPSEPAEFFRAVARGEFKPTAAQLRAMERVEQIEKNAGPRDDLEGYQARLRGELVEAQRERAARRRTPEGLALELRALARATSRELRELVEACAAEVLERGKAEAA